MTESETARGALLEKLGQMIEMRDFYLKQLKALREFIEEAEERGATMNDKTALLILKGLEDRKDA